MPNSAKSTPKSVAPTFAQYAAEDFVQGAGVAIFHIASERVVVCSAVDRRMGKYYFLPKGRRDAGEDTRVGAEREGFEESGYRNRLLPLPTIHHQPQAHPRITAPPMTAEPVWIQMMPLVRHTKQYLLFWYIAETLPPDLEPLLVSKPDEPYKPPPPYPVGLTLKQRLAMEPEGYEPVHHEGTGVDEEEQAYESHLVNIEEAMMLLGGTSSVMADVVRRGWEGIQRRQKLEEEEAGGPAVESPEQVG
ncbi:hypothetical protein BU23DRAFT_447687 [Bimuria novae-zelandiae CBS 107.79]|uniref:Nudix hydrolase domain-containing protein n=1 Tax=Bimuria novae-zelandiae CBS 107.79 TaxID=1447943 RepID=A0A6A5VPM6_9PLEO|nr:hypothetical protein BU23DRAFT_447687 [Bimuria novae-zelandiae CBS 107.79]